MSDYKLSELGQRLLAQVNNIVTGGDDTVKPNPNYFISWCAPGLPFTKDQFGFCEKGLGGGANAEEERQMLKEAFAFSQLVDFIPDTSGIYKTSEAKLSYMYGEILKLAKVAKGDLTHAEIAKLEKFRNLLTVTKKVKDIITDEEKEVTEKGQMVKLYDNYASAYEAARLEYNSKRIAAMIATGEDGKRAIADWSLNAPLYRAKVDRAMQDWASNGYKEDVEKVKAYIQNVTQRSMQTWKSGLQSNFEDGVRNSLEGAFHTTSLIPSDFASQDSGWTQFAFSHDYSSETSHFESSSWSGGLSGFWGLFSGGISAGRSSSESTADKQVSSFKIHFDLTQAMISRPWFFPEFFMNRGWTLSEGAGWTYGPLSDGAPLPQTQGNFIAYPTSAIFARNILIESSDFVSHYKDTASKVTGGGRIGWGPFSLGASYSHEDASHHATVQTDAQSLKVDGMQIIGFVSYLFGKLPNPLETLKYPDDFE